MATNQGHDTEDVWQLVGPDLESYLEGSGLPTVDRLANVLNIRYGPSPIDRLQAFLQDYPEHWEARHDLLRLLRARVVHRLGRQTPGGEQDLDPESDERIWGLMARQLDSMLDVCDWAVASRRFNMYLELPEGIPERRSPRMKSVYHRHRPLLQSMLRRDPENYAIWNALIRIQGTIGGSLLGDVSALPAFRELDTPVFLSVAMFLKRNLHDTSDWAETKRIFRWIWEVNTLPMLGKEGAGGFMDPRLPDPETRGREAIWTYILEPLAEAMIRTESEREWAMVGVSAGDLVPGAGMSGLLRRLNRRDLAHQFRPIPGVPRSARSFPKPRGLDRGLLLVVQGPGASERTRGLCRAFARMGVGLHVDSNPGEAIANYLGLSKAEARWVLLTLDGKTLLNGDVMPILDVFIEKFKTLGYPQEMDKLRGLLAIHPGNLPSLAKLANECSQQAGALLEDRLELLSRGRAAQITGYEAKVWEEYTECLRQLLDDPLGIPSNLLPLDGLSRWVVACRQAGAVDSVNYRESLKSIEILGRGLAASFLLKLEANIARRPSDVGLWLLWLDLSFFSDRDPVALLESVLPSPLANSGPLWPSEVVLVRILRELKVAQRWSAISDILWKRWKLAAQIATPPGKVGAKASGKQLPLSANLMEYLLEALTQMGRSSEVDAIRREARDLGLTWEKGDRPSSGVK